MRAKKRLLIIGLSIILLVALSYVQFCSARHYREAINAGYEAQEIYYPQAWMSFVGFAYIFLVLNQNISNERKKLKILLRFYTAVCFFGSIGGFIMGVCLHWF